ncbi:MAG: DMT family transporter [Magnetovibrio sp.]|nr:DMT family transporter [Magnetovibrio sp.]
MPTRSQTPGLITAAIAAASLGLVTTGVRLAYDGGMSPATLIAFRVAVGVVATAAVATAMRRRLRLPENTLWPTLGVTAGSLMIAFGYMTSVFFIPVSLAALIFYLYPIIVLAISAMASRRLPGSVTAAAFAAAFGGLAMALGPSLEELDWRGLAFALTAAFGGTLFMFAGARASRRMDAVVLTFFTQLIGLPIVAAVMVIDGGPAMPDTAGGWTGLAVASAAYIVGVILQMVAVRLADPAPVSMVSNLEPLVTLILAAVVLGELLSATQYAGGGLVLAAILIAGWVTAKHDANPGD